MKEIILFIFILFILKTLINWLLLPYTLISIDTKLDKIVKLMEGK